MGHVFPAGLLDASTPHDAAVLAGVLGDHALDGHS
jgi:hypothetical protein